MSTSWIPGLRIVTTRTFVITTCTIDRGPETRTIYHCVFYDIKYLYHGVIDCLFRRNQSNNYVADGLFLVEKILLLRTFNMGHTIVQLAKFAVIPTIGSSYEVTGNALQLINMLATALRTYFQV